MVFGGIATTGIEAASRGHEFVGVELEPRFHALALENFELHRMWESSGDPLPVMICGDSRRAVELVRAHFATVVSSPPYAKSIGNENGIDYSKGKTPWGGKKPSPARNAIGGSYGETDGQLGEMTEGDIDATIGSPPFSGTEQPCASQTRAKKDYHAFTRGDGTKRDQTMTGDTPGQIGALPEGDVDAAVGSPPFASSDTKPTVLGTGKATRKDGDGAGRNKGDYIYGESDGQLGVMPEGDVDTAVDSVIGSPPYNGPFSQTHPGTFGGTRGTESPDGGFSRYGNTPGQLEGLPDGDMGAAIGSPPYPSGGHHPDQTGAWNQNCRGQGQGKDTAGYGQTPAQLGQIPEGDVNAAVDGVVASPPYEDSVNSNQHGIDWTKAGPATGNRKRGEGTKHEQTLRDQLAYGQTPGQLGAMKGGDADAAVDGVVARPPWEKGADGTLRAEKFKDPVAFAAVMSGKDGKGNRHGTTPKGRLKQMEKQAGAVYGETSGQVGNSEGETFWIAARQILEQVHVLLKPGGVAAWIVKDYVRNGERVCFCDNWARLCEAVGFVVVQRARAWLVKEQTHPGLFGDVTKRTERKSFFRRIHERRPGAVKIDNEEVIFVQKREVNHAQ